MDVLLLTKKTPYSQACISRVIAESSDCRKEVRGTVPKRQKGYTMIKSRKCFFH